MSHRSKDSEITYEVQQGSILGLSLLTLTVTPIFSITANQNELLILLNLTHLWGCVAGWPAARWVRCRGWPDSESLCPLKDLCSLDKERGTAQSIKPEKKLQTIETSSRVAPTPHWASRKKCQDQKLEMGLKNDDDSDVTEPQQKIHKTNVFPDM